MANRYELEVAGRIKQECLAALGSVVEEVRMFGSRARGTAREDSDLDLLVLTRDDGASVREQVHAASARVLLELGYPFHVVPHVMTGERFQDLLRRERRFALDVQQEGIVL